MLPTGCCVQRTYSQDHTLDVRDALDICRIPRSLTSDEDSVHADTTGASRVPPLALPTLIEQSPEAEHAVAGVPDLLDYSTDNLRISHLEISNVVGQLSEAERPFARLRDPATAPAPDVPTQIPLVVGELSEPERAPVPITLPEAARTASGLAMVVSAESTAMSAISPAEAAKVFPRGDELSGMTNKTGATIQPVGVRNVRALDDLIQEAATVPNLETLRELHDVDTTASSSAEKAAIPAVWEPEAATVFPEQAKATCAESTIKVDAAKEGQVALPGFSCLSSSCFAFIAQLCGGARRCRDRNDTKDTSGRRQLLIPAASTVVDERPPAETVVFVEI